MAAQQQQYNDPSFLQQDSSSLLLTTEDTVSNNSGKNEDRISVWVNPIPLDCGILSTGLGDRSSTKFSFNHLKKIIKYARGKGKHAYPWLSYTVWHHIAKNKLHLSDEHAWLYFETFDTVSDVHTHERLKLLNLLTKCTSYEDIEKLRRQVCVDTVKFILFLYLQNAPRLSLCAPLVTGEEWPSPDKDQKLKSSTDHTHLTFIRTHLRNILELIAETEDTISVENIKGLEFLLLSTINTLHTTATNTATSTSSNNSSLQYYPLSLLVQLPHESIGTDYNEVTQSFSLSVLEAWLRSRLIINPYGSQAMKGGARDKRCPSYRSDVHGRIVSNISSAPFGSHSLLLHGITKQTLGKGQEGLDSTIVYIRNCKGSYIYLLGAMKSVVIDKCSRCVIVLGAIERTLIINNCNGLCVVTACRRLHISSTSFSAIHLLTMTRPLIFGSNKNLTFAPYNTYYRSLEEHLERAGLITNINYWNQPLLMTPSGAGGEISWSFMDPTNFYSMEIPFMIEGKTTSNPCVLPQEYRQALEERQRRITDWQRTVKEAHLSHEKQLELQKAVQERFKEWLEVTGHQREIYDLGKSTEYNKP